jgi:hypothetical protein
MDEQWFEQVVERVRSADAVVATLDPAVQPEGDHVVARPY